MGCKDRGEHPFMLRDLTLTHTYIQENQLAIVEVAAPVPVAEISMEPESDEVSGC